MCMWLFLSSVQAFTLSMTFVLDMPGRKKTKVPLLSKPIRGVLTLQLTARAQLRVPTQAANSNQHTKNTSKQKRKLLPLWFNLIHWPLSSLQVTVQHTHNKMQLRQLSGLSVQKAYFMRSFNKLWQSLKTPIYNFPKTRSQWKMQVMKIMLLFNSNGEWP